MGLSKKRFKNKKILIYGLGKSGISSFNYLKNNNIVKVYDDNKNRISKKFKRFSIIKNNINKLKFDFVVISPGINIRNCQLKNYLSKNSKIIITELDIFYLENQNNFNITVTGTNGKSTVCKLLYDILKKTKKDVRLVGNIGKPPLYEKKINKKTIFVIEVSSYQIEYSKFFKAKYGVILNISPDHLERHGNFVNYAKTKFKLLNSQKKKTLSFCENNKKFLKYITNRNLKVIKVDTHLNKFINKKIKNLYFKSLNNQKNLAFVFSICNKLKININDIYNVVNSFKQLKYRQEIVLKRKKLIIINDSKSTSFSSTVNLLKSHKNIYWIVGGQPKQGDKFIIEKKYFNNISAYVFGNNKTFFKKNFIGRIKFKLFDELKNCINQIFLDIKKNKINNKQKLILFSPSAASFDQFQNFEDRGKYFNKIINKYKNNNKIYVR